jgi:hypothetical protein
VSLGVDGVGLRHPQRGTNQTKSTMPLALTTLPLTVHLYVPFLVLKRPEKQCFRAC